MMKATIRDVAKYAGVSVATVSRYLNNSPLIAEASVEKVRQAIEALDYQPSMMARGLLHGNSKTIALAVDDSNAETYGNDFFLRIQYGLEHELACSGYYLMICHVGTGDDAVSTVRTLINENRIDGLVLLSEMAHGKLLALLRESQIPFVIAGRSEEEDTLWVDIDNIEAGAAPRSGCSGQAPTGWSFSPTALTRCSCLNAFRATAMHWKGQASGGIPALSRTACSRPGRSLPI